MIRGSRAASAIEPANGVSLRETKLADTGYSRFPFVCRFIALAIVGDDAVKSRSGFLIITGLDELAGSGAGGVATDNVNHGASAIEAAWAIVFGSYTTLPHSCQIIALAIAAKTPLFVKSISSSGDTAKRWQTSLI